MQGSSTREGQKQRGPAELSSDGRDENACLERNLQALEQVDPSLAARLRLPVDASKVEQRGAGGFRYRHHREWVRLDVTDPEDVARRALADREEGPVLLSGIGSGELVPALLAQRERLVAWDRDPWHLRLLLRRYDLAAFLNRGGLRLALGIDWLDHARTSFVEVRHPVLGALGGEHEEAQAFREAPHFGPRALLAAGGLFVDEVRGALRRRGFCTWTADLKGLAREELEHCVRRLRPSLLVTINYVDGLAEFARAQGLALVCWEVDPALGPPRRLSASATPSDSASSTRITTYRSTNALAYREAGFPDVRLRPLAADVELRRPLELSADESERWGAPIAFVGSSLIANAERLREKTLALWSTHLGGGEEAEREAERAFERVLADQREARGRNVLEESIQREAPEFAERLAARGFDLAVLLGESAASEKRLRTVTSLADFGISVWGDEGWGRLSPEGVTWRGYAGHRHELTCIYNACSVHVDVGRLYQNDIVPMRVFDVLACGGFLIAERTEALGEAFRLGEELESWSSLEELRYKVDWYLQRPEERQRIAANGRRAVLERHTLDQRVAEMLEGLDVSRG